MRPSLTSCHDLSCPPRPGQLPPASLVPSSAGPLSARSRAPLAPCTMRADRRAYTCAAGRGKPSPCSHECGVGQQWTAEEKEAHVSSVASCACSGGPCELQDHGMAKGMTPPPMTLRGSRAVGLACRARALTSPPAGTPRGIGGWSLGSHNGCRSARCGRMGEPVSHAPRRRTWNEPQRAAVRTSQVETHAGPHLTSARSG